MLVIALLMVALGVAVAVLVNGATVSELLGPLAVVAGIAGGSAGLGLSLRRWGDRRTAARLSRAHASGDTGPVEVGSYVASPGRRRGAVRAIFALGFVAIEYRNGLVRALRNGHVSDQLAAKVRPHLAVLGGGGGDGGG